MTKTKRAVKELNKMADKEILKARIAARKAEATKWLETEVCGYTRGTYLLGFLLTVVMLLVVF